MPFWTFISLKFENNLVRNASFKENYKAIRILYNKIPDKNNFLQVEN
jgi:hypothetical protein